MLELPRAIGVDPETDEEIFAGLGRFGPFVRKGKTFASLKDHDQMWSVTVDEAIKLIKAKVSGKGTILKELGNHPDSGDELVILSGRYGPYVTDRSLNVTLPKGTEPEDVDLALAVDLLAKKAARKGAKKGRRRGKK